MNENLQALKLAQDLVEKECDPGYLGPADKAGLSIEIAQAYLEFIIYANSSRVEKHLEKIEKVYPEKYSDIIKK